MENNVGVIYAKMENKEGNINGQMQYYVREVPVRWHMKTNILMHFDNSDNITQDESVYSSEEYNYNVIRVYGTGELSTSIKKFGDSSFHFTGSNNIYIQQGHGFPFFDGTRFTMEFWYYRDVAFTSSYECLISNVYGWSSGATPYGWWFRVNNSYISFQNGSAWSVSASSSSITLNTWHHIAFSRNGNKARIFVDGTMLVEYTISSYNQTSGFATNWGYGDWTIGSAQWNGSYTLKGYMDEVCIRNGAWYTANFTPPNEPFVAKD